MRGVCLCGAVRIDVSAFAQEVSACHCDMCRRWSGAAMFAFGAPEDAMIVEGPVRTRASSPFAERAWCGECGAHLWFREHGKDYELSPGLFDEARSLPLVREVYADRAFAACRLAGEHRRVTRAEYENDRPHVDQGDVR